MNAFLRYFKLHPWQRRTMTLAIAAIVGVIAAWIAWPIVRNRWMIGMLGSSNSAEQNRGLAWVARIAPSSPRLVRRLNEELPTADDVLFGSIAEALNRLGQFNIPGRPPEQLDRYRALNIASARDYDGAVEVRLVFLNELVRDGRDNLHVRRALAMAVGDPDVRVRADAGALAGRLGDDAALGRLLEDPDASVRAVAALDAGLAGRAALTETLARRMAESDDEDEVPSCAFALARLDAPKHAGAILDRLARADEDKPALRDRLLYVTAMLDGEPARQAVMKVLRDAAAAKTAPPAMALVAAGKLNLAEAKPLIGPLIADLIARREKMTVAESVALTAAIQAARRLKMPPATFVGCIEQLWNPSLEPAMILAVEGLAAGARADDAATIELLRRAAGDPRLPVAAAAAATALFDLAGAEATESLRSACDNEQWLAGDRIAWRLARSGRPEAGLVAADFMGHTLYSKALRSAGAILLAMTCRGSDSAAEVETIIRTRLDNLSGGESDPFVAGSYRCALLILGGTDLAGDADLLVGAQNFPKRRALTALAIAGAAPGFDRVFAAAQFDPNAMDGVLTGRLMAEVYAAMIADLPDYHVDAPAEVRAWQCRILREHYLIHRAALLSRMASWSFRKSSDGAAAPSASAG